MKKQLLFMSFFLFIQSIYSLNFEKDGTVYTTLDAQGYLLFSPSYPVFITAEAHEDALLGPGRKIISSYDTIAIIFAVKTSDPVYDMLLHQSYSTDNGNNWSYNQLGSNFTMRIKTDIDQGYNYEYPSSPAVENFIVWNEFNTLFFTYDENPPWAIYNPHEIDSTYSHYGHTICVWGNGDTICILSGIDTINGWRSTDHGSNWEHFVFRAPSADYITSSAVIENGLNGYAFAFYAVSNSDSSPKIPLYRETTDYGVTWSDEETLFNVQTGGQILSLSLKGGYGVFVSPEENVPYIAAIFDNSEDMWDSFEYGELYFIKPSGGSPGNYVFDPSGAIPIAAGDTSVFEQIASSPSIFDIYGVISIEPPIFGSALWITFSAVADTVIGNDTLYSTQLYAAMSDDSGTTWNVNRITPADTSIEYYRPKSTYLKWLLNPVYQPYFQVIHNIDTPGNRIYFSGIQMPYYVNIEEIFGDEIPVLYRIKTVFSDENILFEIDLPEGGYTKIKLFDASGRLVSDRDFGYLSAGRHSMRLFQNSIPCGLYFYTFTSGGFQQKGKIVLP
ncbi:hypothetical protein JXL83_10345 [candidate division WOR-3 bacterium]|nr:hypothetical protein [candidate division WOR-3 bacterium]